MTSNPQLACTRESRLTSVSERRPTMRGADLADRRSLNRDSLALVVDPFRMVILPTRRGSSARTVGRL